MNDSFCKNCKWRKDRLFLEGSEIHFSTNSVEQVCVCVHPCVRLLVYCLLVCWEVVCTLGAGLAYLEVPQPMCVCSHISQERHGRLAPVWSALVNIPPHPFF